MDHKSYIENSVILCPSPPTLAEKVAVVAGGSGGLGAELSAALAGAGALVVVADRDPEAVRTSVARIGHGSVGFGLDVTDSASIDGLVESVLAQFGRIDILINSAGVYGMEPWLAVTSADYERIFAVNVRGLLFMTQAMGAAMVRQRNGSIVNIASASGRRGNPHSVVYCASKMAAISLTQSAALAFAPAGVRVNAIAPGGILTPMWTQVDALYGQAQGSKPGDMTAAMAAAIPLGRLSTPADYVGTALFLASDASAYVTGQTLNVDGGLFLN